MSTTVAHDAYRGPTPSAEQMAETISGIGLEASTAIASVGASSVSNWLCNSAGFMKCPWRCCQVLAHHAKLGTQKHQLHLRPN